MKKILSALVALMLCCSVALAANYKPFEDGDTVTRTYGELNPLTKDANLTKEDVNQDNYCQTVYVLLRDHALNTKDGEKILSVSLIDRVLTISVYLDRAKAAPATPGVYANTRASGIGEILEGNDGLMQAFDQLIIEFPDIVTATFTKADFDHLGLDFMAVLREIPYNLQ